jgi:hypothetical protein
MENETDSALPSRGDATASGADARGTDALRRSPRPEEVIDHGRIPVWLPLACNDWNALEKLGVTRETAPAVEQVFLGDQMRSAAEVYYIAATLPPGFSIQWVDGEDHRSDQRNFVMLDASRRHRAEIEDSCVEGRFVNTHVLSRFDVVEFPADDTSPAACAVVDRQEQRELLRLESPGKRSVSSQSWHQAWDWLTERFPDWHNGSAYWDD